MRISNITLSLALMLTACAPGGVASAAPGAKDTTPYVVPADLEAQVTKGALASAVFAGGCFWCMESSVEAVPGVVAVISGYAGGAEAKPTYQDVGSSRTGHYEVVRVIYDPAKLSYAKLLEVFWRNIDPTQGDGQFCDHGPQYRSAVFPATPEERKAAEASLAAAGKTLGRPIVTPILPSAPFWPAETYHQDFYKKNPDHYRAYREGCGRDRRLQQLWGESTGH
jgi:peptide-methionine (S)-S-oxide reductase